MAIKETADSTVAKNKSKSKSKSKKSSAGKKDDSEVIPEKFKCLFFIHRRTAKSKRVHNDDRFNSGRKNNSKDNYLYLFYCKRGKWYKAGITNATRRCLIIRYKQAWHIVDAYYMVKVTGNNYFVTIIIHLI